MNDSEFPRGNFETNISHLKVKTFYPNPKWDKFTFQKSSTHDLRMSLYGKTIHERLKIPTREF